MLHQLRATGELDERRRRVVCEPFSRDIRGAATNNSDVVLAQKMAMLVVKFAREGLSHVMPSVLGSRHAAINFADVETDNTVDPTEEALSNRL